ncbi:MAG: hypothetical protein ACYS91_01490 [Planctomycetota bacterium]|jgi:hypothetical protein
MSSYNSEVIGNNQIHLLDELRTLLEKQVEKARQGNIKDVELLSKQAGSLIGKISQTGILDPADPAFNKVRREQLQKLYEELCLAITAQKAGVGEELSRVRKGKKTIQTYRCHI